MKEKIKTKTGGVRMAKYWMLILLAAATPQVFASQSVELVWTASSSPDVVGYNIYYGQASGTYTNELSVGNQTNLTVSGLSGGTTYYFAAKALNSSGAESGFSLQTSYVVPVTVAGAVAGRPVFSSNGVSVTITGQAGSTYVVQGSTDLVHWVSLATNISPLLYTDTNASHYRRRFYRAVYF